MLFTAGEAAVPEEVRHYAARLTYVNGYGPTEASICSTVQAIAADEPMPFGVPIGRQPVGVAIAPGPAGGKRPHWRRGRGLEAIRAGTGFG
jgi:hypothetical protein